MTQSKSCAGLFYAPQCSQKEKPPPTERLTFREWEPGDLDAFHGICSDPRVMRFVGDGEPWSRQKTQQFIERAMGMSKTSGFWQWPLTLRENSLLIGFCGFANSDEGPEIGWRLAPDYWGRELATEAARAVLRHGLQTLDFRRIIATVQAENRPSIRVVEKLGMTLERRFERKGREVMVRLWDESTAPLTPLLSACNGEIASHDCQFVADRI